MGKNSEAFASEEVCTPINAALEAATPIVSPLIVTVKATEPISAPAIVTMTEVAVVALHTAVSPTMLLAPEAIVGTTNGAKKLDEYERVMVP
jgi:hypothetical protein